MTKAELIEKIVRSRDLPPDVTKKCVQQILEITFAELAAYFVRARVTRAQSPRFTFPGFGTFTKKKRSARKGVNPRTLEPITIDAAFTIDFRPGVELRASLNGPSSKASQPGRKRPATSSQLEIEHPIFAEGRGAVESPVLVGEEDDEGALILRRRFTARDDLDEDDEDDEFDELDGLDEASLAALRRGDDRGSGYDLPAAPMQRAEVPGGRPLSRYGSR